MASLINSRLRGSLRSPKWRAFSQAKKSQETRLCCWGTRMTPLSFSQCWRVTRQKISKRPRQQLWPGTAFIEGRESCREAKHRKELIMRVMDSNRHKSDFFFFYIPVQSSIHCSDSGNPANGRRSPPPGKSNEYPQGSVIQYNCIRGFVLHGQTRRTCLENGQWSEAPPKCLGNYCFILQEKDQALNSLNSNYVSHQSWLPFRPLGSITSFDAPAFLPCLVGVGGVGGVGGLLKRH